MKTAGFPMKLDAKFGQVSGIPIKAHMHPDAQVSSSAFEFQSFLHCNCLAHLRD